jgi:hypothetical protein
VPASLLLNVVEIMVVQDPEVAALMYKAYAKSEEFTDLEQFRFTRAAYQRFRHGDMAFFQYQRGAIDEARLLSALKVLNISNPRVRNFWMQAQYNFVEPYRDYINHLIDEKDKGVLPD